MSRRVPVCGLTHTVQGYRSIRATHYVREGTWFYEVTVNVLPPPISTTSPPPPFRIVVSTGLRDPVAQLPVPGSAVRIGWGSEGCDNDSPVGFNPFGWSLKSTDGCIYHRADSTPYARAPILNGDIIGCVLHLAAPLDGARPLPTGGR